MKITISKAADLAGISRQHLYRKYINTGVMSVLKVDNKTVVDISELLRNFPDIKINTDESHYDNMLHNITSDSEVVLLLKTQLSEAKEREKWLTNQIDELRQQSLFLEDKTNKKRKKFWGIF